MHSALTSHQIWNDLVWSGFGLSAASLPFWKRNRPRPYFAHAEYWVYLPGEELPSQERMMTRMLQGNPNRAGGRPAVGKNEALLFSDVRTHIALVLRSKNAHVFRPDLFNEHVEPTQVLLENLSLAKSFVKLRYISEEPLKDKRHLRFLAHAADTICEMANGLVVYDVVAEHLLEPQAFRNSLDQLKDASDADFQTQVVWERTQESGKAETRGLVKVGLPEIATDDMNADQRVLVTAILEEVICDVWDKPELPATIDVRYFDDPYRVEIKQTRKGPAHATLMRLPG